jgi:flagellin-like protein
MRLRALRTRPGQRRGVSNIIAALLLVAMTVIAGTTLWTLAFHYPSQGMNLSYIARAGLKGPVWGDPTDCVPAGYPVSPGSTWGVAEQNAWWTECYDNQVGNYSLMNLSEIVFTAVSPSNIPLASIDLEFLCHNFSAGPATTVLLSGSLASMTWFPGATTSPAPNAPTLGYCGSFDARDYGGGAFGTLYNRLGIFVPIQAGVNVLQAGDTFILYVHTPDSVYDPGPPAYGGSIPAGPDSDDYHGAPTWCFITPGACEIKVLYVGSSTQLLADIPIYSISGAGE